MKVTTDFCQTSLDTFAKSFGEKVTLHEFVCGRNLLHQAQQGARLKVNTYRDSVHSIGQTGLRDRAWLFLGPILLETATPLPVLSLLCSLDPSGIE